MAIGRWKDKEVVVHISSGILLSYKKKCIWISCNDVDEPRAYCTELSKSERERQILYNNAYTSDLEGWYRRSYVQGSKRGTDVRNRLLDSVGEGEGRMIWENSIKTCTLPYIESMTSASLKHEAGHPEPVLCDNLDGWGVEGGAGEFRRGGHMYPHGWFMLLYGKSHHNVVK